MQFPKSADVNVFREDEVSTTGELFFFPGPSEGRIDTSPLFRGKNNLAEKSIRRSVQKYPLTKVGKDTPAIKYIASQIHFL